MNSSTKPPSGSSFLPVDHSVAAASYRPGQEAPLPATDTSVIGNDLTLLGEKITIVSQRRLRVEGNVRGNVHGKHVTVTEGGSVYGTVSAESIEVQGTVRGAIRAVTVRLAATAKVDGDIMHHTIAISEGAHFDGSVRRAIDAADLMPVLDPEAIARLPL